MLESVNHEGMLEYKKLTAEECERRGILGRLVGKVADWQRSTRNGRKYGIDLWEKVFNSPIMKEKIENKVAFGELGHPEDRSEIDMEKIAVCLAEQPKKGKDGFLYAVFDILSTPNGKLLKTLCDYGCKVGVSSRGSGDVYTDVDGNEAVDPDTYECECFDIVLIPAVKEARLQYVTESLEHNKKTLNESLKELVESSNEEDKKVLTETMKELNLGESNDRILSARDFYFANEKPEEKEKLTLDAVELQKLSDEELEKVLDNAGDGSTISNIYDSWWAEKDLKDNKAPSESIVEKHIVIRQNYGAPIPTKYYDEEWTVSGSSKHKYDLMKIINNKSKYYIVSNDVPTLERVEEHRKLTESENIDYFDAKADNIQSEKTEVISEKENTATDDGVNLVEELQKSLKANKELTKQVAELQEKLSVCYAKENSKENDAILESVRTSLKKSEQSNKFMQTRITMLAESLKTAYKENDELKNTINSIKQSEKADNNKTKALTESLSESKNTIQQLREELESVKSEADNDKKKLLEKIEVNNETIADLKKDLVIKETEFNKRLSTESRLAEKYKSQASLATNKFIECRAKYLGINAVELRERLGSKTTFEEIDKVCESLHNRTIVSNKLPFPIEGRKLKLDITESENTILPDDMYDDTVDEQLLRMAGK